LLGQLRIPHDDDHFANHCGPAIADIDGVDDAFARHLV